MRKYSELAGAELFDIALSCKYLSEILQLSTQSKGTTIYIQNYPEDNRDPDALNHCHVHIIPRNDKDLEYPDDIYQFIDSYDKE